MNVRRHWCQNCPAHSSGVGAPEQCHYCNGTTFRSESNWERWYIDSGFYKVMDILIPAGLSVITNLYIFGHVLCSLALYNYLAG